MRYGVAWLLVFTVLVAAACGSDATDTSPTQPPTPVPTPEPTVAQPTQPPTPAPQPTAVPPTQPPTPTPQPTAVPPTQPPTPTPQPTVVPPTQPPTPAPQPTVVPPTQPPTPTPQPTDVPPTQPPTPAPTPEPAPTPTLPPLPGLEGPTIITDIANRKLSDVTIPVGTVVLWSQLDAGSHTTTSGTPGNPSGLWDSGELARGDSFSYTFREEGSFPYFCKIHPDTMRATVQVAPAG